MAKIKGNKKNNNLPGSDDPDEILGKGGNDKLFGNGGDDLLKGQGGKDKAYGGDGDDDIYGGGGNDKLWGDDGDDELYGGGGKDKLWGGEGNDKLYGGGGKDKLYGGVGENELTGGGGADKFYFLEVSRTTVTDAKLSDGDKLYISQQFLGLDPDDNPITDVAGFIMHRASPSGGDVHIDLSLGAGDDDKQIILLNVDINDLAGMIILV